MPSHSQEYTDQDIRAALKGLGFLAVDPDEATEAAVQKAANELRSRFGWAEHHRITTNTGRALFGEVAALQRKLAAAGEYRGVVDGRFDDATRRALEKFQNDWVGPEGERLESTGTLDEATRRALAGCTPYTFDEVLNAELDAVNASRVDVGLKPECEASLSGNAIVRAHQSRLLGLAFSGGGIRSATFNLGVTQALARLGLLRRVDYLSTVSGGGYIGGWLHAWVQREKEGVRGVQRELADPTREPAQISWLRRYSNYLTPRVGLLSADTMAGVATWLRNVFLNQLLLAAGGLVVLFLPWLLFWLTGFGFWQGWGGLVLTIVGVGCLVYAVIQADEATQAIQTCLTPDKAPPACTQVDSVAVARKTILLAALAALLLGLAAPFAVADLSAPPTRLKVVVLAPPALLLAQLVVVALWIGWKGRRLREAAREWWSRVGGVLLSVLLGWLGLAGLALVGAYGALYAGAWLAAVGVVWLATTVAGLVLGSSASTGSGQGEGGWRARIATLAPWVFIVGLLIALSAVLYEAIVCAGPTPKDDAEVCAPRMSADGLKPAYRIDLKPSTEGQATVADVASVEAAARCKFDVYAGQADTALKGKWWLFSLLAMLLAGGAWRLGRRVDINVFAFHMFYRNRLERCYLGASKPERQANPFTDLAPDDSPKLNDLMQGDHVQRPYPLINTALNIAHVRNKAWQERKAAAFLFSPAFCGYQLPGMGEADVPAYQRTVEYLKDSGGWLSLGTPITISGAAASPNSGYHTNPATAFLMTVFNVRLGWWMQNPGKAEHWHSPGPKQSIPYLLKELLADAGDDDPFVYLSDGGHFENLGIYELVRRRCRYIVACDAGCDPAYTFEDLGNAIRKCRIDLGIEIEIDPAALAADPATGLAGCHCAVGRIHYERVDPVEAPGYLLYIKASMTGDEPTDVDQYRAEHPAFPHESTGDQWYSESQFESYRGLGQHVATEVLAKALAEATHAGRGLDQEGLFQALAEHWFPPSRAGQAAFSKHGVELEKVYDRLRQDDNLRFLDAQIYPEWDKFGTHIPALEAQPRPTMLPATEAELRAGFYLCNTLIQLMENVYLDLRLEDEHGHPDNRGWMNLFRHWSWSGMFRVTWAVCVATYGARFQGFCRRHLELESGELVLAGAAGLGSEGWDKGLNFLERSHVERIVLCHYAGLDVGELAKIPAQALSERAGRWLAEHRDEPPLSIRPLAMRVRDPFGVQQDFVFPVGFALLEKRREQDAEVLGLVYYRIQDHLRRMGLGRTGLRVLRQTCGNVRLTMPPDLERIIPGAEREQFQYLWHLGRWSEAQEDRPG